MSFAGLLRQLRTRGGLTQEELAQAATVSTRTVSDLERGVNLTARKETARLLADALRLTGAARALFEAAAGGQAVPAAAVHGLPRDAASFTGRRHELDQLFSELNSVRSGAAAGGVVAVYVIDGMAGVGKTTFAVHAAHLLAPQFPDGQFFLPLHCHTPGQRPADPNSALGTLLLAAGVTPGQVPEGADARAMLWRSCMAGKKVLLVLDDAVGHEQVRPLLPGSAGSLVLVTSRRKLAALEEATPVSLGILSPGDAAGLFGALAARPDADAAAVAGISRLCGFLPLAIRLVAGTLRSHPSWSVTDMASGLAAAGDRLTAMRAENLSVASAFDLSYQELPPGPRRLFRRLGLHPGTSIDACAAAALDDSSLAAARRHLEDLYDHHLITEPELGRYQLHDLLREYAGGLAGRDPAADRDAATGRLLDYYLHVAAAANRLIAPQPSAVDPAVATSPPAVPDLRTAGEAMAWLAAERANLHACADLAAGSGRSVHAVWIPAQLSEFLRTRGFWDQAAALQQRAAAIALDAGDAAGRAAALANLGTTLHDAGSYPDGAAFLGAALALYRELNDRLRQAAVLRSLGMLHLHADDYPAAAASLTQALGLYRDLGDRPGQAAALQTLGAVVHVTGDWPAGIAHVSEALALYRDLGDRRRQAWALAGLGHLQRLAGNYKAATASITEALALSGEFGEPRNQWLALDTLGAIQRLTGDYDAATATFTQMLALGQDLGSRQAVASAQAGLGVVQHLTGDYTAAAVSLGEGLEGFRETGDRHSQAQALNHLGALLADTTGPADALARHNQALSIARDIGAPLEEADALEGIGRCHLRTGDTATGATCLYQALAVYQRLGAPDSARVLHALHQRGIRPPRAPEQGQG